MTALRRRLLAATLFPLGAALFALAYCQAPLYYSNQNQYFLHGLAAAGEGLLRYDWLANTRDPTPGFSSLVEFTALRLPQWSFYAYYGALFGIYAASMLGIFVWLVGPTAAWRRWHVFIALLLLLHAGLPRWCSYHWLGRDYPWYFQAGVAGQYLLGCMFQPSTFGVFLVAAIALFLWKHSWIAGACVAVAATAHSTYLLPGALLTLGFVIALLQHRRILAALGLGLWTLVLIVPITAYVLMTFAPTAPGIFLGAQNILVNQRIPHHARPDVWLDGYAVFQTFWVAVGLILVRRTQLFAVLGVPALLALLLTWVQVYTRDMTLALLFPWRMSTVLVPVATTVILSRLLAWPALRLDCRVVQAISLAGAAGLVAGGIWISVNRLAFRTDDDELPVMDFVRQTKQPGDVYLLPVRDPKLARTVHGAQSTDFKPLAERKGDNQVIPVDLQRFRLATGAPIYVDFKAIPYEDYEVGEWYSSLKWAEKALEQFREGRLGVLAEIRKRGVTHVVLPANVKWHGEGLEQVYADRAYQVYRVTTNPPNPHRATKSR
jgi:hypothetical protein